MHGQRVRTPDSGEMALQLPYFLDLSGRYWDRVGRKGPWDGSTIRTFPIREELIDIKPSGLAGDPLQVLSPLFNKLIPVTWVTTEPIAQQGGATGEELDHSAICDNFRNPPEMFHINFLGGDETLHVSVICPIYGPHLADNAALMPLDVELCVGLERQRRSSLLSWC